VECGAEGRGVGGGGGGGGGLPGMACPFEEHVTRVLSYAPFQLFY